MNTLPLRQELESALPDRPFRIRLWDGSELPSTRSGPTFDVRSPVAFGHLLRAPGELGLGRAFVSGALDVDDIESVLQLLDEFDLPPVDAKTKARIGAAAIKAGAIRHLPRTPSVELRPHGRVHSLLRDKRAVTHHYDVGNEFFSLFLDQSMTYSCAVWSRGATTLEEAQAAKHDLICSKLDLQPGERLLDVGCGWGAFSIHAARDYGVDVTAITLSEPQAQVARERVEQAGVSDRVEIRVLDYRELQGDPFDAVASTGMVEHVGLAQIDEYGRTLARMLAPGGRLLNHGIAMLRHSDAPTGPFSERYVFPDAVPLHLSRVTLALERAGFVIDQVERFPDDYIRTLREWQTRLESNWERAEQLVGAERMRVWAIFLRASRRGFETGFTSVYQVRALRS